MNEISSAAASMGKKGGKSRSAAKRSASAANAAKARAAAKDSYTPERRSEAARKAWETRRKNQ